MSQPFTLTQYDPKRVGALVRHMRKAAGLSREELGSALDLHPASITRIELGTHRISLEKLMDAAHTCEFELRLTIRQQ